MRWIALLIIPLCATPALAQYRGNPTFAPTVQQKYDKQFYNQQVEEMRQQTQRLEGLQAQQQETLKALVNIQAIQTEQLRQQQLIINLLQAQIEAQTQLTPRR